VRRDPTRETRAVKAFKNFINGQQVDAADRRTTAVVNPVS
jgi:hypothetical protein